MDTRKIIKCLNAISFISNIEKIDTSLRPNRGVSDLFSFEMEFQSEMRLFYIGFKPNYPLEKPIIFLRSYNQFGFIPHIDPDGYICFAYDEGLVLDFHNPTGIIEESLHLAVATLDSGVKGINKDDFFNEFDNYLVANKFIKNRLLSLIEVSDNVCEIRSFGLGNKIFLCESLRKLKRYNLEGLTNNNDEKIINYTSFVFVPLDAPIEPHEFDKRWYKNEIIDIIDSCLSKVKKTKLNKLLFKLKTTKIILYFRAPNLSDCLVSFDIKHIGFNKSSEDIEVDVYPISRIDSMYVNPRGCAYSNLSEKKVLLVGCGSVGGFVAHKLIKSGITNVTLVDDDKFSLDNISRHILGMDSIGESKTDALKKILVNATNLTNISSYKDKIENVIESKIIKLKNYDLVISATGNPTVNLWLNERLIHNYKTSLIVSWVEPYGIGGHNILISNPKNKGCYCCLMDQATNHNLASFYCIHPTTYILYDPIDHRNLAS